MFALSGKVFQNDEDLDLARKLVNGCVWAYESAPLGIMPETMHTTRCANKHKCVWDEKRWHQAVEHHASWPSSSSSSSTSEKKLASALIRDQRLPPGVTKIDDPRYILRPEAIESLFILYRTTGDETLREKAWTMFTTIIKRTRTPIAHASLEDCTNPDKAETQIDQMESFWLAETLKYFYLIFADPNTVVNLDELVLNTETHPLRRERPFTDP